MTRPDKIFLDRDTLLHKTAYLILEKESQFESSETGLEENRGARRLGPEYARFCKEVALVGVRVEVLRSGVLFVLAYIVAMLYSGTLIITVHDY